MKIDEIIVPSTCIECMLVEKVDVFVSCRYYSKWGKALRMGEGRTGKPEFCKVKKIVLIGEDEISK